MKNNYVAKYIKEIDEDTLRIRILGNVIEQLDDGVIIDDGTGAIKCIINKELTQNAELLQIGKMVIVFGKVVNIDEKQQVFIDFVVDAESLNFKLYKKAFDLFRELNARYNDQ